MDDFTAEVLDVVDSIPPGYVMTYGDIADFVGHGGPRQVGHVMSTYGGGVPWWRVIRSDGTPPPGHEVAALKRYRAEGTPLRSARDPLRVDMSRARWSGPRPAGPHLALGARGVVVARGEARYGGRHRGGRADLPRNVGGI